MGEVKWIKLAVDIFDNRKIKQIEAMPEGNALIVTWLKLLVLAGDVNDGGLVYFTREIPYTDQLLATEFNMPLTTIQLALATFQRFGMIEIIEDLIHISNWEKYQNVDSLDRIREQTRKRVAAYRQRKRLALAESNVTSDVTVTKGNGIEEEVEEDKEEDRDIEEDEEGDTVFAYASANLNWLSPTNYQELVSFTKDLPDAVVRHAIDEACANNVRTWAYVRKILNTYLDNAVDTVEKAKELHERRKNGRKANGRFSGEATGKYQQYGETI